jgi:hypothetical protein
MTPGYHVFGPTCDDVPYEESPTLISHCILCKSLKIRSISVAAPDLRPLKWVIECETTTTKMTLFGPVLAGKWEYASSVSLITVLYYGMLGFRVPAMTVGSSDITLTLIARLTESHCAVCAVLR